MITKQTTTYNIIRNSGPNIAMNKVTTNTTKERHAKEVAQSQDLIYIYIYTPIVSYHMLVSLLSVLLSVLVSVLVLVLVSFSGGGPVSPEGARRV